MWCEHGGWNWKPNNFASSSQSILQAPLRCAMHSTAGASNRTVSGSLSSTIFESSSAGADKILNLRRGGRADEVLSDFLSLISIVEDRINPKRSRFEEFGDSVRDIDAKL